MDRTSILNGKVFWKLPIVFLFLSFFMLWLGTRLESYIIFFSCLVPFVGIFMWLVISIRLANIEEKEEDEKHETAYIYCGKCKKYVDVNKESLNFPQNQKFVDKISLKLDCGHEVLFNFLRVI